MSENILPVEKPTENWTKFPNSILDNLEKFSPAEIIALCLMVRKNIGYEKPNRQFSSRYVSKKTGISQPTAIKVLDSLEAKKSILCVGFGQRGIKLFDINWSNNLTDQKNLSLTDKEILSEPLKNFDQVLDNRVKENKSKRKHRTIESIVLAHYNKVFNRKLEITTKRTKLIRTTVKERGLKKLLYAIYGLANDPWIKKEDMIDIEHKIGLKRLIDPGKRDDNIDKFSYFPFRKKYMPPKNEMTEAERFEAEVMRGLK